MEMEVSRSGRVVELNGTNADGKSLIDGYEYEGKDRYEVADELADRAIEMDYLANGGEIVITANAQSAKWVQVSEREIQEELGIPAAAEDLKQIGVHDGIINGNFYGREFRNHEISAVYVYDKPVEIENLSLQKEEVEEVIWMDYNTCREKMEKGEIKHCIFQDEFEMLGEYLGEIECK